MMLMLSKSTDVADPPPPGVCLAPGEDIVEDVIALVKKKPGITVHELVDTLKHPDATAGGTIAGIETVPDGAFLRLYPSTPHACRLSPCHHIEGPHERS